MAIFTEDFFNNQNIPADDFVQLVDSYTKENVSFIQTTFWIDNSSVIGKDDGVVYRKKQTLSGEVYYCDTNIIQRKPINVMRFGVVLGTTTDNSINFQHAVNTCIKLDINLLLPAGTIAINNTIVVDYGLNPNSHFGIIGGGMKNSIIAGSTMSNQIIDIRGIINYDTNGNHSTGFSYFYKDFSAIRYGATPVGAGIRFSKFNGLNVENVEVQNNNEGIQLHDIVNSSFKNIWLNANTTGIVGLLQEGITSPNLLNFVNCTFTANVTACVLVNLHSVKFDSCSIEGNTNNGISMIFNAINGRVSSNFINCYFENNGNLDIYLECFNHGTHNFIGNTFNRVTQNKTYCLEFRNSYSGQQIINFIGNGFLNVNTYPENQNLTPLKFYGSNWKILDTNMYDKQGDYPNYTNMDIITF